MIITIDGPVASGKSTVAQALAHEFHEFGFYYLYTGLLYRALAYALVTAYGYSEEALVAPGEDALEALLQKGRLEYRFDVGAARILFDGKDITSLLKTEEVDRISSISSANAAVRAAVYCLQQQIATGADIIADGRDTGTVVFPNAQIKFFLTASVEERAFRWRTNQARQGNMVSEDEAITAVTMRDERDRTRKISPLLPAEDAILVDNSNWSIEETITYMAAIVRDRYPDFLAKK